MKMVSNVYMAIPFPYCLSFDYNVANKSAKQDALSGEV